MAEIQPQEGQINGGGTLILNSSEPLGVGSKRQRRPSVRLGDIGGDPSYDSHPRRNTHKPWKPNLNPNPNPNPNSGKPSKTRPLTNLSSAPETLDDREPSNNLDSIAIGSWKIKESSRKRASTKRVRSNWVSRIDEGGGGEGEEKFIGGEGLDDGCREFDADISESPIHSMEILGVDGLHGRSSSFKGTDHHDGIELSGPSDTDDARDWKCDRNNNGVRVWLNALGLGRYAPVFEVHEVDDEVLPMLTLEDLKDMGISAVGSRRKMYCAIQKLGKGFS